MGKLHDKKWPKMRLVAQDQITVGLESHPEDLGLQLMNRHPQHLDEFLKVNAQLNEKTMVIVTKMVSHLSNYPSSPFPTHTHRHTHTKSVMGKERKISKVKGDGADDVAKESLQAVRAWDLLPDPGCEILAGCLPSVKTLASQVTA